MFDNLFEIMMKEVGCTAPWVLNQSFICQEDSKAMQAYELYQKHKENMYGICPKPCASTQTHINPQAIFDYIDESLAKGDKMGIALNFRRTVKETQEYFLENFNTLFAKIGGLIGMILGVSNEYHNSY